MIRTQLYLPESTHRRLKELARERKQAMAQLVRTILEQELQAQTTNDGGLAILRDVGRIQASEGPADLSTNLDHYLYGSPKKKNSR
jgi:hypothetical protein